MVCEAFILKFDTKQNLGAGTTSNKETASAVIAEKLRVKLSLREPNPGVGMRPSSVHINITTAC